MTSSLFTELLKAVAILGVFLLIGAILDEIAGERGDIKVAKVNVDEQPELAGQFGVMSIPTLVVMKDGKVVQQAVGVRPKAQILSML